MTQAEQTETTRTAGIFAVPYRVRQWLARGDAEQRQITAVEVRAWRERSSFNLNAPPICDCCEEKALPEGHFPVRAVLAESETCHEFDEVIRCCDECAQDWEEVVL